MLSLESLRRELIKEGREEWKQKVMREKKVQQLLKKILEQSSHVELIKKSL